MQLPFLCEQWLIRVEYRNSFTSEWTKTRFAVRSTRRDSTPEKEVKIEV